MIIGSGAAGLNCAIHLVKEGIDPSMVAIVTDNLGGGTSFNAGSDKQTYYKMSIIGDQADSPHEMAKDFHVGGAMHGDIALIESSNSLREFFHLVHLGVPFPHDQLGGFVGYKTDNDPRQRATSIGPLTSQKMCKCLLKAVRDHDIRIYDKHHAIKVLVDHIKDKNEAIGLICTKTDELSQNKNLDNFIRSIKIFKARNVIIATGGPAILYKHSVYPETQKGTTSLAIEAGCMLQNLTESQFGLASVKFRWNLSGSYQQVIPRYYSVDENQNRNEFLREYFPSFKELSKAIFLKGYQWPFNSERIENCGSSLIDLAVYHETEILGKKVFLDYRENPLDYDFESLDQIVQEYLINSKSTGETPIKRLKSMNEKALSLYLENGIDLRKEAIQIALCNQHMNGGVSGNIWWETTVKHLFAVGEVNGSHGVHRPGGAALNSGQVGGLRVSQKIGRGYDQELPNSEIFNEIASEELSELIDNLKPVVQEDPEIKNKLISPFQMLSKIQNRMSKFGGIIRDLKGLKEEVRKVQNELKILNFQILINNNKEIIDYFRIKDALFTQLLILNSILDYHEKNGKSRGSYLILRQRLNDSINEKTIEPPGKLKQFGFVSSNINLKNRIQTIRLQKNGIKIVWEEVRDVPKELGWFENVWKDYSNGRIFQ